MIRKIFLGFNYFLFGLQLLFLILKWTGAVDWHWFYVLIPLVCYGIFIIIFFAFSICIMASEVEDEGPQM